MLRTLRPRSVTSTLTIPGAEGVAGSSAGFPEGAEAHPAVRNAPRIRMWWCLAGRVTGPPYFFKVWVFAG